MVLGACASLCEYAKMPPTFVSDKRPRAMCGQLWTVVDGCMWRAWPRATERNVVKRQEGSIVFVISGAPRASIALTSEEKT